MTMVTRETLNFREQGASASNLQKNLILQWTGHTREEDFWCVLVDLILSPFSCPTDSAPASDKKNT